MGTNDTDGANHDAFLIIHPFMWRQLGLKGIQLLVFARVYGFCKGGGTFFESRHNTASYLGISERSVIRAIGELEEMGLLRETGGNWLPDGYATRSYVLGDAFARPAHDKLSPPDKASSSLLSGDDEMSFEEVTDWHLISKEENKGF